MLLAALLGVTAATPSPLTLMWDAPPECPNATKVLAHLSEQLGRTPASADGTPFAARGAVQKTDEGWRLELQTLSSSGAGTRAFVDADCEKVTQAGVLALALAIDPELKPLPRVELARRSLWLSAGPQARLGTSPFPAVGLSVQGTIDLERVAFGLSIASFLPQRLARDAGTAVQLTLPIEAGLAACVGFHVDRLAVHGCATAAAALLLGQAEGVERPFLGNGALLTVGPRARARVLITSSLAVGVHLEGAVALLRPSFRFANGSEAFTPSLWSGSATLLMELKLW
jgi:hypothetical protein